MRSGCGARGRKIVPTSKRPALAVVAPCRRSGLTSTQPYGASQDTIAANFGDFGAGIAASSLQGMRSERKRVRKKGWYFIPSSIRTPAAERADAMYRPTVTVHGAAAVAPRLNDLQQDNSVGGGRPSVACLSEQANPPPEKSFVRLGYKREQKRAACSWHRPFKKFISSRLFVSPIVRDTVVNLAKCIPTPTAANLPFVHDPANASGAISMVLATCDDRLTVSFWKSAGYSPTLGGVRTT